MRLLHRYIFASVAYTSLAAVAVLAFVLLIANVLKDLLGWVLAGQIPFDTFVHLTGLTLVVVISYALPMGILTGVLLVLGRLSSDREIVAIRASGVSVAGISAPIFFFALLCTGASLAVNFYYMPRAKVAYETELAEAIRANPLSIIVPKTFIRDYPGVVIYVSEKRGAEVKDFWGWKLDHQGRVLQFARAKSGHITYDEATNRLLVTLTDFQADMHDAKDPEDPTKIRRDLSAGQFPIELSLARLSGGQGVHVKPKWKTFTQLLDDWRRLNRPDPKMPAEERSKEQMKVQTTIQEKFATGFSVLSFALIAIPLGIKVSRKETSANLGVALVLAMGYYLATVMVGSFENQPAWRPDLLMWVPNIAFQALGGWMFYKIDR